jgi:hypothetical protein
MPASPWTPEDEERLRTLVAEGCEFADIGRKLSRTPGAVAKKAQLLSLSKPRAGAAPWGDKEQRDAMVLDFGAFQRLYPKRTYNAYHTQRKVRNSLRTPDLDLTDYTRLVEAVEGDAVVCACVHVPQTDPDMWFRALAVGERDRIPHLIIAGDIVTGDMFSHWDTRESWDFDKELDSLYRHLTSALGVFDYIYITPGNHISNRIVRTTNGHIRLKHMVDMAGLTEGDRARIFTTDIDFLELTSGSERFLIGHATNYSNVDGRVSMLYAEKEECHVITGNGHRFGQQASKSGRWFSWDIGTMADPRYMGYANRALTKFPKMTQSFLTVRNGAVKMYAAGLPVTDWESELGHDHGRTTEDGAGHGRTAVGAALHRLSSRRPTSRTTKEAQGPR